MVWFARLWYGSQMPLVAASGICFGACTVGNAGVEATMRFTDARALEQVVYTMRLSEYPRSLNRARVNSLANGTPPYDADEVRRNHIAINVNNLSLTRLAHDARSQLYQAFEKPGAYFTARTDFGPKHKRQERGVIVSREINRLMKRSLPYLECMRSKFALQVLHGA